MRILRTVLKVETGLQRARQGLTAGDERPPPSPSISIILLVVLLLLLHVGLDDLFDIANLDQHVLRFEVGMDDTALSVQIVQSE